MDREMQLPSGQGTSDSKAHGKTVVPAVLIGTATFVILLAIGFAIGIFNSSHQNGLAQNHSGVSQAPATDIFNQLNLFQGWDRPALAIVLTGEQHGYLQPCGCSNPQYGGLVRRFNLIQELRKRAWPIVAADLGDVNQIKAPKDLPNVQGTLKYVYAMRAMDQMFYSAVNFGEFEMRMPLSEATGNYALNNPTPRIVSASLLRPPGSPFTSTIHDHTLASNHPGPKVGLFGLTGPSVVLKVKGTDPNVAFPPTNAPILAAVLPQMKAGGADFIVLLYQGNKDDAKICAEHIADQHQKNPNFPLVDVIVCLSDDPQPPAFPLFSQSRPMILQVGHKGLNVGVVGVYPGKGAVPFELKYQLVAMGPEFDTPKGQEKGHKIMALMEEYTAELKSNDYLAKYKQVLHPLQAAGQPNAEYVGSFKCQNCHQHADKVWAGTPHSHAYNILANAKHPSNRQFDGECIVCHTVGFGYKTGFENFDKTKHLTDVGCESCHGPCSEHVSRPNNQALYPEINPWKWRGKNPPNEAQENYRLLQIDTFCQKCHDLDNDNNFQFNVKWPKVIHMTPPANAAPQVNAGKK